MVDYAKALKCARFSKAVYRDFSTIKDLPDTGPDLIDFALTDTQVAIFTVADEECIYIVFRGSDKQTDWDTNFDFSQSVLEFKKEVIKDEIVEKQEKVYPYAGGSSSGALMHRGFVHAYLSVRDKIHESLAKRTAKCVTVAGHSLGGALATLCAVDVQYNFSDKFSVSVYTYGSPRVGNDGFRESFNRRVPDSYRFVYGMDAVPALPRPWQGYRHVDTEYRLGQRFSIHFLTQRFKDHDIDNYIKGLEEQVASGGK